MRSSRVPKAHFCPARPDTVSGTPSPSPSHRGCTGTPDNSEAGSHMSATICINRWFASFLVAPSFRASHRHFRLASTSGESEPLSRLGLRRSCRRRRVAASQNAPSIPPHLRARRNCSTRGEEEEEAAEDQGREERSRSPAEDGGHAMLHNDYFADDATQADNFRRRYRMSKGMFMNILHGVREFDPYFKLKVDVVGILGFSSVQKCTAAMRMLAYGAPADTQDDYLRMSESTAIECMYKFYRAVVGKFGKYYLRGPTEEETARIMAQNAARGFPGMLGSIDCMHWAWKNCPKDVERAFGVLQAQFAIVRYPALTWSHDQMWEVMQACVIMHNMIIEDDRKNHARSHVGPYECQGPLAEVDHELPADFADFLAMHAEIPDSNVHEQLQADLVEHLWRIKGNTVAP
ncbi:hypothetical protein QYE76_006118 [Lolium multiflorum]|uniref:Uncharacterized protein n=1 Tax=Lolium multiflorum TaxID=4521 RepID=A0AAD8W3T0_LOLMU|nr:hypothetical protein QYE76_006118 [Lolium multiflorum]